MKKIILLIMILSGILFSSNIKPTKQIRDSINALDSRILIRENILNEAMKDSISDLDSRIQAEIDEIVIGTDEALKDSIQYLRIETRSNLNDSSSVIRSDFENDLADSSSVIRSDLQLELADSSSVIRSDLENMIADSTLAMLDSTRQVYSDSKAYTDANSISSEDVGNQITDSLAGTPVVFPGWIRCGLYSGIEGYYGSWIGNDYPDSLHFYETNSKFFGKIISTHGALHYSDLMLWNNNQYEGKSKALQFYDNKGGYYSKIQTLSTSIGFYTPFASGYLSDPSVRFFKNAISLYDPTIQGQSIFNFYSGSQNAYIRLEGSSGDFIIGKEVGDINVIIPGATDMDSTFIGSQYSYVEIDSTGINYVGNARPFRERLVYAYNMYGSTDLYNGVDCEPAGTVLIPNNAGENTWIAKAFADGDPPTQAEAGMFCVGLPPEYDPGTNIFITFEWTAVSTTGNVAFGVGLSYANDTRSVRENATYITGTTPAPSVSYAPKQTVIEFDGSGLNPDDSISLVYYRDGQDPSDTMDGDAYIFTARVRYYIK